MTVKTGIGVMPRSAKDFQQQSQTGRGKKGPLPSLSLQRVHGLADTLISDFLVSRTAGEEMSVVLSCPIYGTLFWPPRRTHTASHSSICRSTTPAVTSGRCSPQHWGALDGSCWRVDRWAPEQ